MAHDLYPIDSQNCFLTKYLYLNEIIAARLNVLRTSSSTQGCPPPTRTKLSDVVSLSEAAQACVVIIASFRIISKEYSTNCSFNLLREFYSCLNLSASESQIAKCHAMGERVTFLQGSMKGNYIICYCPLAVNCSPALRFVCQIVHNASQCLRLSSK